jgi:hypothetical protein
MAYDIFISHANEDEKHATAACDALESGGVRCWIAPRDIDPGKNWSAEIIKGIESSRTMLVILSAHANESNHIRREVGQADERHLPLITFRVEDVKPADSLAYYLDSTHWLDAFPRPKEKHPQLVAAVKRLLTVGPPPPEPAPRPRPRSPRWPFVAGAALLTVAVGGGALTWLRDDEPTVAVNVNVPPGGSPAGTPTASPASTPPPGPSPVVNSNVALPPTATPTAPPPPPDENEAKVTQLLGELNAPGSSEDGRSDVIFRLGPLAKKNLGTHERIVRQLTAFIRNRAARGEQCSMRPSRKLPADLQAALDVLATRRWYYGNGETEPLELSETDLSGAYFSKKGVHFEGVRLRNACLNNALLDGTSFRCAYLSGASVNGIDVNETDFYGADLSGLKGLRGAADFRAVFGVARNLNTPSCAQER